VSGTGRCFGSALLQKHKRCGQGSKKNRPMNKETIDVETICLIDEKITIACGLVNKNESDGKPTYTNIFCSREELIDILLEEKSTVAKTVFEHLWTPKFNEYGVMQIDIQDINNDKTWIPTFEFKIEPVDSEGYEFLCYRLTV
jgi:hypothetical protein